MSRLLQTYSNFRFLARSVRWVELFIAAVIVFFAREVSHLQFPVVPVVIVFAVGFLWNVAFWYAGQRHLLSERGPSGARLLVWCWVISDVVTNLLIIHFTGLMASPFLFFMAIPVILSTVALGRPGPCYGVALGSALGLGAMWAMDRAGSIPHFASYPAATEEWFLRPEFAAMAFMISGSVLCLLVYTIFRFRPNFFVFQESIRNGHFRIQSFRAGSLQDLRLEEVETVGPEDLLEEVVQNITLCEDVVFGAALVLPAGEDTIGGRPGTAWHRGLNRQRSVCTTRRQVIPTWNEFNVEQSELFRALRDGQTGDLWEGPFPVLQSDGLYQSYDEADSYLATVVSQAGRAVVVLIAGLRHPVRNRNDAVLHLLNVAAQLKPLLVVESRLSEMRGELSALHNENEALNRANKAQSDFVSIASHELKTPLTAISAYTDALLSNEGRQDFPERGEFLKVIHQEADRLLRMVNRILDFSQIEFGNRGIQRKRIELKGLLDECLSTMRPQLEEKRLELAVKMPPGLPRIEADRDLLKQVLLNLLTNAVKFSPDQGRVYVSASERASVVEITVRDEGPGIPDHELPHIFKQFYRVRDERGDGPEGSGLGLTIVRNIVEQHGGRVAVDGGEGRGASFTFSIPKEQCTNDERETLLGAMTQQPEFRGLMKMLVRMIADYMECKIVSVMLLSADREELFVQVAYGLDEEIVRDARTTVGEGISGRVAATGRALLVESPEDFRALGMANNPQYETNSLVSVPLMMNDELVGVINCNNKVTGEPFYPDDLSLLITLTDKVTVALSRALEYADSREQLSRTVTALQSLVDLQQSREGTTRRAVRLAMDVGRRMGMTRQQILGLQYACVVHDVGMVRVGEEILSKPDPLNDEERGLIRTHPSEGLEMLHPFLGSDEVDEIVRHHHERVDGGGYPSGLTGEHIPLAARIVSVVDAYDSMTSPRPYRGKTRPFDAARELVAHADTQFDGDVVRQFLDVLAESGELSRDEWNRLKESELWLRPASLS
jgi:signal transduction histidine kinase/HD-GYP domain-containing protein (c-di-GMP phosphodiesterase class II)